MIRRAREDDWGRARALWREADDLHAQLAPAYFRKAARAEREWRELLTSADTAVFVAEDGDGQEGREGGRAAAGLTGVVSVRVYETPPDPAMVPLRRGHVEMLVVTGARRRGGVGARLMAEVAAWARRQGAAELVLTVWSGNRAAEAFYDRLGYRELSRVLHSKL
ncbi:MAG TPA: GNAT family N-acetyltransferase [Polyangia bacterium]|jgi:ribosomal protein S18 acetylase RimI-like enzyme